MSKWQLIDSEAKANELVSSIDWADSFLVSANLIYGARPVWTNGKLDGVVNSDSLPNARLGIMVYIDNEYRLLEIVLSQVKKFVMLCDYDIDIKIAVGKSVLESNREINLFISDSDCAKISAKKLAIRISEKLENDNNANLIAPSMSWETLNRLF